MALDMFLKLDGIDGESQRRGHEREIDVLSYSFGVAQETTSTGGGGGAVGRADLTDLNVVVVQSRATPLLLLHCLQGRRIPTGRLSVVASTHEHSVDFWVVRLQNVLVTSVHEAASSGADSRPTDAVSLRFNQVEWEYRSDDSGPVVATWDRTEHGTP